MILQTELRAISRDKNATHLTKYLSFKNFFCIQTSFIEIIYVTLEEYVSHVCKIEIRSHEKYHPTAGRFTCHVSPF